LKDILEANRKILIRSSYLLKLFKGSDVRNLAKTLSKVGVETQLSYNENLVSNSEQRYREESMCGHRNPETGVGTNLGDWYRIQPRINEGSPSKMGGASVRLETPS
jgi:hypothetical protein